MITVDTLGSVHNKAVGRYGEELAVRHLKRVGLSILARNWRCAEGELDVVARDGDTIVFVEVKTRTGTGFGTPAAAVDFRKMQRLRGLALRYLMEAHPPFGDMRFDVVSVLVPKRGAPAVEHLRQVF